MTQAVYECTLLHGTGKQGIIKKDADGYYLNIIAGAFNIHNTQGDFYSDKNIDRLFSDDQPMMKYLKDGQLCGEWGHPVREKGMTDHQWLARIYEIREACHAFHVRSVRLDANVLKDPQTGAPAIACLIDIRPYGPYKESLQDAMDNKHHNLAFSVRNFSNDTVVNGKWVKHVTKMICWDAVTRPGVPGSFKYNSPTMEGDRMSRTVITPRMIDQLLDQRRSSETNFESDRILVQDLNHLKKDLFQLEPEVKAIHSLRW